RWRAGDLDAVPPGVAEPVAREMVGDPAGAAACWEARGCPYEAARALQLKLGNQARAAGLSEQIAAIEVGLGDYDHAHARYQAAIAVYRRLSQPAALAQALKGDAFAHRMQGASARALALYGEARGLFAGLKQPREEAAVLEAMGVTHRRAGNRREALACLQAALDTARRLKDDFLTAGVLGEIGRTHQDASAHAQAVAAFREAVALFDRLENPYLAAVFLNEMATPLALQGRFSDAAQATQDAIERLEAVRATAEGEARRDFLAKQVSFYEDLVVFSSYQPKPEPVYLAAEQGRARFLSETLAQGAPVAPPPLAAIRQGLADHALVLSYTSTAGHQVQMAIDKRQATVTRLTVSEHFQSPSGTTPTAAPTTPRRGVTIVESDDQSSQDGLAAAIHRYRALLQSAAPADQAMARRYGRALYDVLIKPQAARLGGKTDLLIVPSAELAALPFETLIDEQGRYLAEGFRVRYAQSLTVWHQLGARRHPAGRQPMLALGGARYGLGANQDAGPMAPGAVRRWVARSLEDRVSLRPIYQSLGLDAWTDLPGTRDEVAGIARAVPGATVLT
ncbi:MAG: CHAT domain-containing protein, partial [Candidatus Sericytochromatia bacterium]